MENLDIISAKYNAPMGTNVSIQVVLADRTLSVPLDPANRHYAEIMRQVESGELVIQEAES
jgi:hypothetical protein